MQRIRIVMEFDISLDVTRDRMNAVAKYMAKTAQDDNRLKLVYLATEVVEEARNILEDKT